MMTFPAPSVPGTYVIRTDYTPTGTLDPAIRRLLKHLRVTHFVPEPAPPQLVFPVIASQKGGAHAIDNIRHARLQMEAGLGIRDMKPHHKRFLWPALPQASAPVRLHLRP